LGTERPALASHRGLLGTRIILASPVGRDGASSGTVPRPIRVGLISDTHGLLRLEAKAFLSGCDLLLHGGDVGAATILDELARIAPLTTVRGNNDREPWGLHLHEAQLVQVGAVPVYLIHNIKQLALHPPAPEVRVVVSGHSHQPMAENRDGVLFVNPGSSGPRRFKLPVAAGELWVSNSRVSARIVDLLNGQTLARA
jgi:uncharacterized protein